MTRIARLDYPGHEIRMHVSTPVEEQYRIRACAKEPWTIAWIESMPAGAVLYDIGANVGSYTLVAAALGHTVVAIEPSFANFNRLCENVLLNDLGHKVIPLCVALGKEAGTPLMEQELTPGYSGGAKRLMVWRTTLDALRDPTPIYVKIDVDGAETDLLTGAGHTIQPGDNFLVEVTNAQTASVEAFFAAQHMPMVQRWDSRPDTPGLPPLNGWWYGNFVK